MSSKQNKDTFILRCEFYPQIKRLEREQRGDLLNAIFAHATGDECPTMDGVTAMCFEFIRASMDTYANKYKDKCLTLSENGKKGGRPKKEADDFNETECLDEKPNESKKTKRFLNEADGFSETKCLDEKPNESKKTKIPPFPPITPLPPRETESESDNTHTVVTEMKGGVGENNASVEARRLVEWIATNVPTVASMDDPITEQNAVWMLRKYSVEDIKRIILAMHNKRAYRNVNAYVTFGNFARRDLQLNGTKADTATGPKAYTWDEILVYVDRNRPKATTDDFERQVVSGRPVWFRKSDLLTSQQPQQ